MSEFSINIFKIKKIQRLYRTNKIIKENSRFLNLNLKSEARKDFNIFSIYIKSLSVNKLTETYIKSFLNYKSGFKLSSRILLTAYIMVYYQDEILGQKLNQFDQTIIEWSKEVIERIDNLHKSNEVYKLWLLLNNYYVVFTQWKNKDKSIMVESIIISYYNRSKHIEKVKSDKKLSKEDKKNYINELNNQRLDVLKNIKMFDSEFDTEYFKENYELIYENIQKPNNMMKRIDD